MRNNILRYLIESVNHVLLFFYENPQKVEPAAIEERYFCGALHLRLKKIDNEPTTPTAGKSAKDKKHENESFELSGMLQRFTRLRRAHK